jgi:hypothetical protein
MLHERIGANYPLYDGPKGGAINGLLYALPVAAALWVAIAGLVYIVI